MMMVMRADNHGEGGILALTSLVIPPQGQPVSRIAAGVVTLGVFGTALLYGDGLITPAISVLSAVEGFEVATPAFDDWVIPIAVAILVVLFVVQHRGTAGIAKVFSPIMVVWFTVLGVLGVHEVCCNIPAWRERCRRRTPWTSSWSTRGRRSSPSAPSSWW
jgi:KUP system potassium uptake protein